MTISVSVAAREWLAKQGFDPEMGARPMKRVIQEQIKRPLADDLLFGELVDGGDVRVEAPRSKGDKLHIKRIAREKDQKMLPAATE